MRAILFASFFLLLFPSIWGQDVIQENTLTISSDAKANLDITITYQRQDLSDSTKALIRLDRNFFESNLKKGLGEKLIGTDIRFENLDQNGLLTLTIKADASRLVEKKDLIYSIRSLNLSSASDQNYTIEARQTVTLPVGTRLFDTVPEMDGQYQSGDRLVLEWEAREGERKTISFNFEFPQASGREAAGTTSTPSESPAVDWQYYGGVAAIILVGVLLGAFWGRIRARPRNKKGGETGTDGGGKWTAPP